MSQRADVAAVLAIAGFALVGVVSAKVLMRETVPEAPFTVEVLVDPVQAQPMDAGAWLQSFRGYCNPVDVETRLRWQPAPQTHEGEMHKAACYALAGKIDEARAAILGLPQELQYHAAGVVFNAGHPAADAGDEVAAGPLMELVVEFWPNHYMALYHAGAAAFERGEHGDAQVYLKRFLVEYTLEDGWRINAHTMLEQIARGG